LFFATHYHFLIRVAFLADFMLRLTFAEVETLLSTSGDALRRI